VETIQVSVAHAYPGTEFYDFAVKNGFIVPGSAMVDKAGHQIAHIQYPNISPEYVLESVHRFYDEYYFRPKAIYRILRKAVFNNQERRRLYKEAKAFLTLRASRKKYVKEKLANAPKPTAPPTNGSGPNIDVSEKESPLTVINA
jgi:hypothetical protein